MGEKRNLIIVRAGDNSLHREWLQPAELKNFDLWINYNGDESQRYVNDGQDYFQSKGTKWPQTYELVERVGNRIFEYDAVWIPDDDVSTNAGLINRMFQIFHEEKLMLAQPALTKNALFQVTARHIDYKLRYTSFVEGMAPIFSREALRACWRTFNTNLTGSGIEHLWVRQLGYPHKKIAIIDETPISHTRPQGSGDLYRSTREMYNIDTWESNETAFFQEYGINPPNPKDITFYDGILKWNPHVNVFHGIRPQSGPPGKARRRRAVTRKVRGKPGRKRLRGRRVQRRKVLALRGRRPVAKGRWRTGTVRKARRRTL